MHEHRNIYSWDKCKSATTLVLYLYIRLIRWNLMNIVYIFIPFFCNSENTSLSLSFRHLNQRNHKKRCDVDNHAITFYDNFT